MKEKTTNPHNPVIDFLLAIVPEDARKWVHEDADCLNNKNCNGDCDHCSCYHD